MKFMIRITLLIFAAGIFAAMPARFVSAEGFPLALPEAAGSPKLSPSTGSFLSDDTPEPTPTARRPTHTPEPVDGAESSPSSEDQSDEQSRLGYYIALGVLGMLMLVNMVLGRIAKRNRQR